MKLLLKIGVLFFACVGLVLVGGYIAVRYGFTNTHGIIDTQNKTFVEPPHGTYTTFVLAHTPEWIAFRMAIAKDTEMIRRIERETGIPARTLISPIVPEQMRLFHTERPVFKQFFEPLKILGSQSQFSWGIAGIKDETAREVERRLKDATSPSYLGAQYEHILDFKTEDPNQERFDRITDERNHYYAYLYTALYLKEIEAEWTHAGFDISKRPEILATLYNLGFSKSNPKANPEIGGAQIDINGTSYSFGSLAGMFYVSDELVELFPQK